MANPTMPAAATGQAARRLEVDRWDVVCALGLGMLVAGVWVWAGLGVALTVAGLLLLAFGVAGALAAERAAKAAAAAAAGRR